MGLRLEPGWSEATRIELSQDIRINGELPPAGNYSIWAIRRPAEWTLIFSRKHDVFHIPYPGPEHDALRLQVRPESGAHVESMEFVFPVATRDSADLELRWGSVVIPFEIRNPD